MLEKHKIRECNKHLDPMKKASKEVQYPYAFDENDHLVCIDDVVKETRHDYSYHCPNCGHSMLPRLGNHNAHCFAHSENQACGVESYIHKMAKIILTKRFNDRSRPFTVYFRTNHICREKDSCKHFNNYECQHLVMDQFDLHQVYDLPAIEEVNSKNSTGDSFRPDVIVSSSKHKYAPIYLEVFHKHRISPKKRISGQHIIEIQIKDWKDLTELDSLEIKESDDRISFYNFKDRRFKREDIKKEAEAIAEAFAQAFEIADIDPKLPFCFKSKKEKREVLDDIRLILYPSGKSFCSGIFEDEKTNHKKSALADITYNRQRVPGTFDPLAVLAKKIPKVRRCTMCYHCRQNEFETNMWCDLVKNGSLRKNTFDNQKGVTCSSFKYGIPIDGQSDTSLKEGFDYEIWVNPKP